MTFFVPFLSIRTTFIFFRGRVINIFHWDLGPLTWVCSASPCCAWQSYFLPFHSTLTPLWQKKPPQLLKSISYFPDEEGDACGKLHIMCYIDTKHNMSHFCLFLISVIHFTSLDFSGLILLCVINSMSKLLLSLLSFAYWCPYTMQSSPTTRAPWQLQSDNTLFVNMCYRKDQARKNPKSVNGKFTSFSQNLSQTLDRLVAPSLFDSIHLYSPGCPTCQKNAISPRG